ncbi:MAG: vitamin K epoxide reductase family protein [Aggregatilineales bacterium]
MTDVIADYETPALIIGTQSRPWLKWLSILLALAGTADAVYLTYSKLTDTLTACPANGTFNCELVQHSIYSEIAGIPIAYIGLAGYLAILAVLLLDGRFEFFTRRGALLTFGLTLLGFLYSGFLTSTEAFILHAWCLWCLGSAIVMTCLFVLSGIRAWRQIGIVPDDDLDAELMPDGLDAG